MLIISDFSKTFTSADMPTTWSVFAKSNILGEEYISERNSLYNEFSHFEQEGNIEKTEQWFLTHAELFIKYGVTQDQIDMIVMNDEYFCPRSGVREFLDYIIDNEIPLIIVTSGITNFVSTWFQKRYNYNPEIIFGNDLIIESSRVVWVDPESITTPLDKSIEMENDDVEDLIIIGDNREDALVVKNPKLTLGFTDDEKWFDIKLGKEGNMSDIIKYLK